MFVKVERTTFNEERKMDHRCTQIFECKRANITTFGEKEQEVDISMEGKDANVSIHLEGGLKNWYNIYVENDQGKSIEPPIYLGEARS